MFNVSKTDVKIKEDVVDELKWSPQLAAIAVAVSVKDGIVTLSGTVPHYFEKLSAERAAQRVGGVRAVVDDIEVRSMQDKKDEDIAKAASNAINWSYSVPDTVKVLVDDGWITLSGEVEWDYQRKAAEDAVSNLYGVRGIINQITLKVKAQVSDIKARIEQALKRSAEEDVRRITVSIQGNKAILDGTVHSYSEIEDARLAAWRAPGILAVESHLKVAA